MYVRDVVTGVDCGKVWECGWMCLGLHHRECGSRTYIEIFIIYYDIYTIGIEDLIFV